MEQNKNYAQHAKQLRRESRPEPGIDLTDGSGRKETDGIRKGSGWENFILIAIVLVIIHTFISELSIYYRWTVGVKNILILLGLWFDLTFTIEFALRSIYHCKVKKFLSYLIYERGWVDFLSSVPLLVLNSGPLVFLLLLNGTAEGVTAIGVLNILKIVKAIRVTRILRLIRVMKIFGKIRNADSKMAQHHTTAISTIAVSIVLFVLFIFTFSIGDTGTKLVNERTEYYEGLTQRLLTVNNYDSRSRKELVKQILIADQNVLKLYYEDSELFSSVPDEEWDRNYSFEDYFIIRNSGFKFFISLTDINRKTALNNLLIFSIVITLVFGFMFLYTRHFVQTISDVIFILRRGFREKGYSLQVKIPEEYADHEIFQLARFYNEKFLPAKMKRLHRNKLKKKSQLSMNDLFKFKNR